MVAGARSDLSDHDAAVTSRDSVTTCAVAAATRARDVDAKRSIAKRQDDSSSTKVWNQLPISSRHPRPVAVVCDAAARCASHPPPGLRPFPQSFNHAIQQSLSRHPPADSQACTAEPVNAVVAPRAYEALLDGVLGLVDVERTLCVLNLFANYELELHRLLCQMRDRSHAAELASQAQLSVLQNEMVALEESHCQPPCNDPHGRFARPGTLEMLCCKTMAALDRETHGERHSRRGGGASSFGSAREPAYGRCPLTGREMPREFTEEERAHIYADPEPAIPPEPNFLVRNFFEPNGPPMYSKTLVERKHYLQIHFTRVADIRRAHNAGRPARRDQRIAATVARAVAERKAAVQAATAAATACAARPPVIDGKGTELNESSLPLSSAVSQDMHVVLCRLHAAGNTVDADLVRRLREVHRIRFDVHAHNVRKAGYADLDLSDPVHARASLADNVIADERATRTRGRRGCRSPTGRPNLGSVEARASIKRAKACA